jgi:3-oxoacyl-[acyl-carrier protein] reductase
VRTALVTGGAKGIGRGIALALAAGGWNVAVCYRTSAAAGDETVREIDARGGHGLAVQADVGEWADAERLFAAVTDRFGAPDALVHCAGPYHRADFRAETAAGWREMLAGNLDSLFYCAKLCAPAMQARGWGRILGFSMAAPHDAAPGVLGHHVAKTGVLTLLRAFARDLAPHGVTANAISPGYIDSGSDAPEHLARMLPKIPAGRLGTVDDVVGAATYLLSDAAAYVTGTNLVVSGGWGI